MTTLQANKPLYIQIATSIRSDIYSGKYAAGNNLPTENKLCEIFSVSKITVRKAVELLEKQGLIKKIRGKGTFVCYRKEVMEIGKNPIGFSGFFSSKGHQLTNEFLQTKTISSEEQLPDELTDKYNKPVVYIQRLISEGQTPIGIDNIYISSKDFPGILEKMLADNDLYKTLENNYGVKVKKSNLKINGIVADLKLAEQLKCTVGDPLFVVNKTGLSKENNIIHFSKSIVRCDRVEYSFSI